jgi:anti-sigma factor RsiW
MAAQFIPDPLGMEVYLQTDPELHAHLLEEANKVAERAKAAAPVGAKEHTLKGGYVDKPGDYRDSIEPSVVQGHRRMKGRVTAHDYKAHWIEYGSKHNTAQHVLHRAIGGE